MSTSNNSLAGNFESAAQRMAEAVQKVCAELSQSVNECIEQLQTYSLGLESSITDQLRQIAERFQVFAEEKDGQALKYKEQLLVRLNCFERDQIETVKAAARSVRQSLSEQAREAEARISQTLNDELEELEKLLTAPEKELCERSEEAANQLAEFAGAARERIGKTASKSEEELAFKIQDFEGQLQEAVERWKQAINEKIELAQDNFKKKADELVEELDKLVKESLVELEQKSAEGAIAVSTAIDIGKSKGQASFDSWKEEVSEIQTAFLEMLKSERAHIEATSHANLESRLAEASSEILSIRSDTSEKLQFTHRTLDAALKRLEQDYRRRLETLASRFDSTLSESLRRFTSTSSIQHKAARDLQEKLKAQLTVQGTEIMKVVAKLSQHLESEYVKASQCVGDNIESISSSATEALEKQVQIMKNDLKKVGRTFQDELDELEAHLSDIEIAGKKAAEMVMTYRSALLSLGGD